MRKVVIATTTFSKNLDLRLELALKTIKEAGRYGYSIVVVDGGSPDEFIHEASELGAIIETETSRGIGSSRRQAKKEAGIIAGKDGIVVWMEPEKYTFVKDIYLVTYPIEINRADLVVPSRYNLNSYPLEQQYAENLGNLAAKYLTGRELDMWFGPKVMNQRSLKAFLEYDGRYGDTWDSIQVPVLDCIFRGLEVESVKINYEHPSAQSKQEEGNLDMLLKRVDQLKNIVPALMKAAQEYGIKSP